MATANWRETVAQLVPTWLRAGWGERLSGYIGLVSDVASEGMALALRAAWLREATSPADVLPLVGRDSGMPRYPVDTDPTYRLRLAGSGAPVDGIIPGGRWDAWRFAGTEAGILGQLSAMGYPNAAIVTDHDGTYNGIPSWSRFFVVLPIGSHSWAPSTHQWGDATLDWGDTDVLWGVEAPAGEIPAMRGMIAKFKAAYEVCDSIIAISSGTIWGSPFTAHEWGEPSLVWGADVVAVPCTGAA